MKNQSLFQLIFSITTSWSQTIIKFSKLVPGKEIRVLKPAHLPIPCIYLSALALSKIIQRFPCKSHIRNIITVLQADCSEIFNDGYKQSGFYKIKPIQSAAEFSVYCDMSDGGGWTVIQRRSDGTVNFNRYAHYDIQVYLGEQVWEWNSTMSLRSTNMTVFHSLINNTECELTDHDNTGSNMGKHLVYLKHSFGVC